MDMHMIWEAIKQPLRQALLFLYAFALNKAFDWILATVGFSFTEEQKIQLISFGTPIVWSILSFIDNLMHRKGVAIEETGTVKKPIESSLTTGITRF